MGMSALLAEATRLVGMFQDKEKGINTAVAAAVSAVPAMSKIYYVNAITGDDATGLGDKLKPFKTIAKAVNAIPYGGGGYIRLFGHEHVIDSLIFVISKNITIAVAEGETVMPILRNVCIPANGADGSGNLDNSTTGFMMDSSTVVLDNLRIRTANYAKPESTTNNVYTGLFRRYDRPLGMIHLSRCEVELGDTSLSRHTINGQTGIVSLYSNKISRVGPVVKNTPLIETAGTPIILSAQNNTLPAGAKWSGDYLTGVVFDSNGAPRSVVSNLVLG